MPDLEIWQATRRGTYGERWKAILSNPARRLAAFVAKTYSSGREIGKNVKILKYPTRSQILTSNVTAWDRYLKRALSLNRGAKAIELAMIEGTEVRTARSNVMEWRRANLAENMPSVKGVERGGEDENRPFEIKDLRERKVTINRGSGERSSRVLIEVFRQDWEVAQSRHGSGRDKNCVYVTAVYGTARPVTNRRRKVWGSSTQTPPNLRHDLERRPTSDHRELFLDDSSVHGELTMISGLRIRHPWSTEDLSICKYTTAGGVLASSILLTMLAPKVRWNGVSSFIGYSQALEAAAVGE